MEMHRAYAVLDNVKAEDGGRRVFSGLATNASPDRMGDTIDPLGAKFKNPLVLLHQHDRHAPIGSVKFGKPTKNGITFEAEIPNIPEPGSLKDRVDTAWGEIKHGLVRGVSVGFRSLKHAYKEDGGIEFQEIEILELSIVSIPANAEATIQTVKSIDTAQRAASGQSRGGVVRLGTPPGASGKSTKPQEGKQMNTKVNVQDQIKSFTDARTAKVGEMDAIMEKSAKSGETLDKEDEDKYDTLKGEVATIDKHLERLKAHEASVAAKATAVAKTEDGGAAATQVRQGTPHVIAVEKKLAPGVGFARYAGIMAAAKGSISDAVRMAKDRFPEEKQLHALVDQHGRVNEMISKAAIDIGLTTDSDYAAPLVYAQNLVSEFLEFLRPQTIIGKIQGLRRVPFNVRVPRQTNGGTASWVGEAKPKPVSQTALDYVELKYKKLATIAVISQELARFSSPSAEMIIRDTLAKAIVQQMDADFVDPTNNGTANVKPASITYGVTPVASGGDTEDKVRGDVRALFAPFIAANLTPQNGVWIMSATNALSLSLMVNSLGQRSFPDITMNGGTFFGMPVVVSEAVGNIVVLANASDILIADDGGVTIDTSSEASVQMDSTPDDPSSASTVMISLWQRNLLGIRAERFIDWVKARTASVQYLSGVEWGLETT